MVEIIMPEKELFCRGLVTFSITVNDTNKVQNYKNFAVKSSKGAYPWKVDECDIYEITSCEAIPKLVSQMLVVMPSAQITNLAQYFGQEPNIMELTDEDDLSCLALTPQELATLEPWKPTISDIPKPCVLKYKLQAREISLLVSQQDLEENGKSFRAYLSCCNLLKDVDGIFYVYDVPRADFNSDNSDKWILFESQQAAEFFGRKYNTEVLTFVEPIHFNASGKQLLDAYGIRITWKHWRIIITEPHFQRLEFKRPVVASSPSSASDIFNQKVTAVKAFKHLNIPCFHATKLQGKLWDEWHQKNPQMPFISPSMFQAQTGKPLPKGSFIFSIGYFQERDKRFVYGITPDGTIMRYNSSTQKWVNADYPDVNKEINNAITKLREKGLGPTDKSEHSATVREGLMPPPAPMGKKNEKRKRDAEESQTSVSEPTQEATPKRHKADETPVSYRVSSSASSSQPQSSLGAHAVSRPTQPWPMSLSLSSFSSLPAVAPPSSSQSDFFSPAKLLRPPQPYVIQQQSTPPASQHSNQDASSEEEGAVAPLPSFSFQARNIPS